MTEAFKQGFMDKMAEMNKSAARFNFRLPKIRLPRLFGKGKTEEPTVLFGERFTPEEVSEAIIRGGHRYYPATTVTDGVRTEKEIAWPDPVLSLDNASPDGRIAVPTYSGTDVRVGPKARDATPQDFRIMKARLASDKAKANPLFGKKLTNLASKRMSHEGGTLADGTVVPPEGDGANVDALGGLFSLDKGFKYVGPDGEVHVSDGTRSPRVRIDSFKDNIGYRDSIYDKSSLGGHSEWALGALARARANQARRAAELSLSDLPVEGRTPKTPAALIH